MKRWASLLAAGTLVCFVGCSQTTSTTGPSGETLEISFPASVTVTQGEEVEFEVEVDREKFTDAITIEVSNLPEGVTLVEDTLEVPKGAKQHTFHVKAAADAKPVEDHPAKAKGSGGDMEVPEKMVKVTVKKKD